MKLKIYLVTVFGILFIISICLLANKNSKKSFYKKTQSDLELRVDSLEKRIKIIETLYRAHLEECSFISKYDIEVGYDNYLRLRTDNNPFDYGIVRNK